MYTTWAEFVCHDTTRMPYLTVLIGFCFFVGRVAGWGCRLFDGGNLEECLFSPPFVPLDSCMCFTRRIMEKMLH